MADKEFDIPNTLDIDVLAKKIAEKMQPATKPDALSESMKPTPQEFNYKTKVVEMLKDTNTGFKWTGENPAVENKFFEAIGAVSAGSAVPEIWAKDVFRCCPYPASAFWDAPYIKWHDDIKGKPGDTIHVVTVGRAICGTAGCAEPSSTAATISATAITLEEYQCSYYICRDDLEDVIEDTITQLNDGLITCLDNCIDNAFIANIIGKGSTLSKGTAYITPAHIAEAIGTMRAGNQVKRITLILRTCICEPVCSVCKRKVNQEKQFAQNVNMSLLVHQLKVKQIVLFVGKKLFSTQKLIDFGLEIGEKTILKKLQYKMLLDSKEAENCMSNFERKEETNVTSVEKPIPDLNFMKSMGKNTRKIRFTTFPTDMTTLFYLTKDATKQHNGHLQNLGYLTLNSKKEYYPCLLERNMRPSGSNYSPCS
jgi:hypothetical protein